MVVEYERRGSIAVITLNRPEVRNAVNADVATGLEAAVDRFEAADGAWAAVLTGAGGVFCAGADLSVVRDGGLGAAKTLATERGGWGGFVRRERAKPVIAAVEGWALAGGCELALACDLVVASRSARFGLPEVKRSLIAAAGGLIRLPRVLPRNLAMEMVLTGDPLNAIRAHEHGLVTELCDDGGALEAAVSLAERVAANAPLAVQASRRLLLEALSGDEEQAWRSGYYAAKDLSSTADFAEGPRAFLEKRPPVWQGR